MSVATYEHVKNINEQTTVLIDVREPSELAETGVLPKSINIPLGQLEETFKNMPAGDFESKFGLPKPEADRAIILSCKAGGRAQRGVQALSKLGYNNLSYYKGSWTEWAEKNNIQI